MSLKFEFMNAGNVVFTKDADFRSFDNQNAPLKTVAFDEACSAASFNEAAKNWDQVKFNGVIYDRPKAAGWGFEY